MRITDIDSSGMLSDDEVKYITLDERNTKYLLKEGDLLVARIGATYGKTLYYDRKDPAVFASYLIRLTLDEIVLPKYYFYFSQSDYYWDQALQSGYRSRSTTVQCQCNKIDQPAYPSH